MATNHHAVSLQRAAAEAALSFIEGFEDDDGGQDDMAPIRLALAGLRAALGIAPPPARFLATVHYRTAGGGNTWMGDVEAPSMDQAHQAARLAFRKARPMARSCRIDRVDVMPAN